MAWVKLMPSASTSSRKSLRVQAETWMRTVSSQRLGSTAKRDDYTVLLGRREFLVVWWLVFVYRGCEIAFLTAMTGLYHWLLNDPLLRYQTLDDLRFDMSYAVLDLMNWWFVGIDVLLAFDLFQTAYFSVMARELTFNGPVADCTADATQEQASAPRKYCIKSIVKAWNCFKSNWFEPLFYINGEHFDLVLLVQEYIEVSSQIYQGYQMSVYVATRWINHLFVGMIVLNCVSTPILHHFFPASRVRLVAVIINAVLNFVNSVVIPFVVFWPYVRLFDVQSSGFPVDLVLNDVFYARAIRENQQLFVTSYLDFVSTWVTHWSLYRGLLTFESLIRRVPDHPTTRHSHSVAVVPLTGQIQPSASDLKYPQSHQIVSRRLSSIREKLKILRRDILGVIGILVLGIHIVSQSPREIPGCNLLSTPWFTTKSSCVIMNVNCYRRNINGTEQQVEDILRQVDPHSIFQVMFTHCQSLEIPPVIRDFTHLGGFDIYNCTIHQWRSDASLHADFHRELNYLWILRSGLATGIPEGLLDTHFPPTLQAIQLYDTNLSSLPENVDEFWQIGFLGIEFGQFETVPSVLVRLPLAMIMASGNPMTSSHTGLLLNGTLGHFYLSNSSLATLPHDTLGNLESLQELQFEYTQLTQVPKYLRDWYLEKLARNETIMHSLYGSPYCTRTIENLKDDQEQLYQTSVCAQDFATAAGYLPMQYIDPQRLP